MKLGGVGTELTHVKLDQAQQVSRKLFLLHIKTLHRFVVLDYIRLAMVFENSRYFKLQIRKGLLPGLPDRTISRFFLCQSHTS